MAWTARWEWEAEAETRVEVEEDVEEEDDPKEDSKNLAFVDDISRCLANGTLTEEAWNAHVSGESWQIRVR